MNKTFIVGGAVAGLMCMGAVAGMVSAQTAATATGLTEEQVIEIALTEVPGQVLEVEFEHHRGQPVYEVEIRADTGAEFEVEIAAETGNILAVKADDDGCGKGRDDDDAA